MGAHHKGLRANRAVVRREEKPTEPVPDTHCPDCNQRREVKGFPQGYKHGKKVLCDICQEAWVRRGCADKHEEMLLPAQRRRGKHKSSWDA